MVQVKSSIIFKFNFIGNAIDFDFINVNELTARIYPHPTNQTSFKYPNNCFLQFTSTISDQKMHKLNLKNKDHHNNLIIMVSMKGNTSDLCVGCLNTIHAFIYKYFTDKFNKISKVSILPSNSKSGPFSHCKNSKFIIINSKGEVYRMFTDRDKATDVSDCTYLTLINFLLRHLADYRIKANIFPLPTNL